jgi:hypothetical protein
MTPVEVMTTSVGSHPSRAATRCAISTASEWPPGPVATLAFFEITTTACACPSAICARLRVTLGPANRLLVNTPATGTACPAVITTKSSVSSFTPMLATWLWKPSGRRVIPTAPL